MVKKKKKSKSQNGSKELKILESHIEDTADDYYYRYSLEVIEDRAIFGEVDGLKPVTRRLLWAGHELGVNHKAKYVKAAKLVGDTMGNYHPHGNSSIYTAAVTAANMVIPMIDGSGNWGTMTDDAAAERYTNARLSLYSDLIFFDKFYLPVVEKVLNYDESRMEPLVLPTLLPNALVNGNFGIAPGVRASSPIVRFDTLIKALINSIADGASASTCKGIELITEYGGVLNKHDTFKADMKNFLLTGRGRFVFDCQYTEISDHEIRIHGFPFSNLSPNLLEKVESIKAVAGIRDDSSKEDRNVAYVVTFKKVATGELTMAKRAVLKLFQSASTFNMQAIERRLDENGVAYKKLNPTSIPGLLNSWIAYRVDLEKKACSYWIDKRAKEIERLELMVLAVRMRDFIIKALNKKLDDEELAKYIAKGLKITVDQANMILDLKIRSLKALEEDKLKKQIKALKEEISTYKHRIKKPKEYILQHVKDISKKISAAYVQA